MLRGVIGSHGLHLNVAERLGCGTWEHRETVALEALGRGLIEQNMGLRGVDSLDSLHIKVVVVRVRHKDHIGLGQLGIVGVTHNRIDIDTALAILDGYRGVSIEVELELYTIYRERVTLIRRSLRLTTK